MEMAVRDLSVPVRVESIRVLTLLDASGFLSDEDEEKREGLGCLMFDKEPKVRKVVAALLKNWYFERVEDMKAQVREERDAQGENRERGKPRKAIQARAARAKRRTRQNREEEEEDHDDEDVEGNDEDEDVSDQDMEQVEDDDGLEHEGRMVEFKVLASMLVDFSTRLDQSSSDLELDGIQSQTQPTDTQSNSTAKSFLAALVSITSPLNTHATVGADLFWNNDVEAARDWEGLVEFLTMDHSTSKEEGKRWALEYEEEGFLLDFLTVIVTKALGTDKGKKKMMDADEENDLEDAALEVSHKLIDAIPKLFVKYQSDSARMAEALRLASRIKFETFTELRLTTVSACLS